MTSDLLTGALAYASRWPTDLPTSFDPRRCLLMRQAEVQESREASENPTGFKDATHDPETIRRWWVRWPDANIGMPTGAASGFLVVDVDGERGEARLAGFEREHGPLPDSVEVKTPRGRHVHLEIPLGAGFIPSIASGGLDVRADGGYVILPPSCTTGVYEWTDPSRSIALAPTAVIAYARGELLNEGEPSANHSTRTLKVQVLARALQGNSAPPPFSLVEATRIRAALKHASADEYDDWLRVGMALHWT